MSEKAERTYSVPDMVRVNRLIVGGSRHEMWLL